MSRRKKLQLLLGVIVFAGVWDGGQAQSVTQASSSNPGTPQLQKQAVQPAKSGLPDSPPSVRTSLNVTTEADYSTPAPGAIVLAAAPQTAGGPMPHDQVRARHSGQVSEARSGPRDSTPSLPLSTIPEPTHGTMLLCGLAVVAFMARRKSSLVKS